jgi:hypothetical protein
MIAAGCDAAAVEPGGTEEAPMSRKFGALVALALAAVVSTPAGAQGDRVAAGSLTCDVSAGFGLIVGSRREVSCTFTPSTPAPQEFYTGTFTKVGVDIGVTGRAVMVWLVYSPTSRGYGALAGNYIGATAEASVAVGLGANVLVGGNNRTIALQPVSVQGQIGLNVAVGVGELTLRLAR